MKKNRLLILLFLGWVIGILYPIASTRFFSPSLNSLFDSLFSPDWVHVVAHLLLYIGLGLIAFQVFSLTFSWKSLFQILGLALLVGLGQELLQSAGTGLFYLPGVLFDLGVDMAGGLIGWALAGLFRRRSPGPAEH